MSYDTKYDDWGTLAGALAAKIAKQRAVEEGRALLGTDGTENEDVVFYGVLAEIASAMADQEVGPTIAGNLGVTGTVTANAGSFATLAVSGAVLFGPATPPANEYDGIYVVTPQVTTNVGRAIKADSHYAGTYGSTAIEGSSYIEGAQNQSHTNAVQSWVYANGSGIVGWAANFYAARTYSTGTITNFYGFFYAGGNAPGAGFTNEYAFYGDAVGIPSFLKGKLALSDTVLTNTTILYPFFIYKPFASGAYGITTAQMGVFSNDAAAVGKGGAIALGGKSGLVSDPYVNAFLFGGRESLATYAGYFAVYTTSGGGGSETNGANYERFRIASTGAATFTGSINGLTLATSNARALFQVAGVSTDSFGSGNSYIGYAAGAALDLNGTDGAYACTFVGGQAGAANTKGYRNTFVGNRSGTSNTTGNNNTSLGQGAGYANATGSDNVSVGFHAGLNITNQADNICIGSSAGTGAAASTAAYNTFVGKESGRVVSSAQENVGVGRNTLQSLTSGGTNVAVGNNALNSLVTGSGNVCLGYYAGAFETGSDSFYVNNQSRTNTAGDKAKSLMYGVFNATAASQTLALNAAVTILVGFGCNGAAAQTAYASGGALASYGAGANGFDSGANASALYALVVAIRAALVANGTMS